MSAGHVVSGAERIAAAFASARSDGRRAALMPYVMAGFPDLARSGQIARAYVEAGADLIELGVPFSDPLADGPVIHAAGVAALAGGVRVADALGIARAVADDVPVVAMCYMNLVLARGIERFADLLVECGVSGLIVPDLPLEEAPAAREALDARGLALVPLVAPTTPDARLAEIGARASGFLYTVSVVGTTGERASVSAGLADTLARSHAHTTVPVAVGFGISTPAHARAAADAGADGVIFASRLVRAVAESEEPVRAARELVASFAAALGE